MQNLEGALLDRLDPGKYWIKLMRLTHFPPSHQPISTPCRGDPISDLILLPFSQLHAAFSSQNSTPRIQSWVFLPTITESTITKAKNQSEVPRALDNADVSLATNAQNDSGPPKLPSSDSMSAGKVDLADNTSNNMSTSGPSGLVSLQKDLPASPPPASVIAADLDSAVVSVTKPDSSVDSPQPEASPTDCDHSEHDGAAKVHVGDAPSENAVSPPSTRAQIQRGAGTRFTRVGSTTQKNEAENQLTSVFMSMAALTSNQMSTIRKDAQRTHILDSVYKGRQKEEASHDVLLLLNAYALWDTSVGYCQVI